MSSFENSHNFSKIGEGKSHCLVTNELRKENGHKNRFCPISEKTNSFTEIQTGFWIAKTALDVCTFKFLPRRFWSRQGSIQTLCRAPISVAPSDSRVRKMSDSRIFLWFCCECTIWPGSDLSLAWAEWGGAPPGACTKLLQFVGSSSVRTGTMWLKILLGSRGAIFLGGENEIAYTI